MVQTHSSYAPYQDSLHAMQTLQIRREKHHAWSNKDLHAWTPSQLHHPWLVLRRESDGECVP